ncbi:MAG: tetratricopeptide repeat protein, partial [Hyphomicrobiales bacterium]|nr:tetratricopeptide repeat protein [Hyphomicrobiales bacterium]
MSDGELHRTAQYLGQRYQRNPDDKQVAIQYAQVLVGLGRTEQAVAVLQRASIRHPKDREVYSAYGKVLVADGKFTEALKVIDQVQTPDRPDWRLYSAKGTILDQMGEHGPARQNYEMALKIVPGEPSILSNLGLSYALT